MANLTDVPMIDKLSSQLENIRFIKSRLADGSRISFDLYLDYSGAGISVENIAFSDTANMLSLYTTFVNNIETEFVNTLSSLGVS
jgi:hypothetical protein